MEPKFEEVYFQKYNNHSIEDLKLTRVSKIAKKPIRKKKKKEKFSYQFEPIRIDTKKLTRLKNFIQLYSQKSLKDFKNHVIQEQTSLVKFPLSFEGLELKIKNSFSNMNNQATNVKLNKHVQTELIDFHQKITGFFNLFNFLVR
jgi:hypothetical protein